MHNTENWDDLRFVLAVAEAGSVSAAARQLGVNHATVLRRVAAFEARNRVEMFRKTRRGYEVNPDRVRLLSAILEVRQAIEAVGIAAGGGLPTLRGVVRVTSTDSLCQIVLPRIVASMHRRESALRLELASTNAHLDLSRLNADITVRPAKVLDEGLSGEQAATLGFAVYTARDGDNRHWLAATGPLAASVPGQWISSHVEPNSVSCGADSYLTMRELVAEGLGRAFLPCVLGEADERLRRVPGVGDGLSVPIWVASHRELADVPRIRAARRLLAEGLAIEAEWLAGTTSRPAHAGPG